MRYVLRTAVALAALVYAAHVPAQLNDTLRGNTRGAQLTYFADDDRLLVDGEPQKPAASRVRGKKQ